MSSVSVKDIGQVVQGQVQGNESLVIEGAAGLDEASQRDISFFHNMKYVSSLEKTKAGAVLIPEKTVSSELPEGRTWIRVANPQWAFAQVLGLLYRDRQRHPRGIHPKAVIDPTATIAPGVHIGALAVIEAGVTIETGVIIYPGAYIGARSRIGEGSLIYPNVVLREDTELGARVIIHAGSVLGADGCRVCDSGRTSPQNSTDRQGGH